jgi:hypothetical protein
MELKNDLLKGAARIADYADVDERAVYHWADLPDVPVFRVGRALYARRSQLDAFFTWRPANQQSPSSGMSPKVSELVNSMEMAATGATSNGAGEPRVST